MTGPTTTSPSDSSDINPKEAFENSLYYYLDAVRVVSLPATGQSRALGGYNVARELQLDVGEHGPGLALSPASYEYRATGDVVAVCAQFDSASPDWVGKTNEAKYGDPVTHSFGTWTHGPGRHCLTRNVAP